MSSGNIIAEETKARDWMKCDGGVDLAALRDGEKCPKCGATDDEFCKFTNLVDTAKII